jgi:2-desacetyl-2-hydroxyethyl bacteriochlorophyllide A dehydrogenase
VVVSPQALDLAAWEATMRAVVFPRPNAVEVRDVDQPTCGPREVVLRVGRAGICGTDLHIHRNEYMAALPLIPGHEFVGRVEQVGAEVSWPTVGDRVVADPNLYCNVCDHCRRRMHNHCLHWQGVGITRGGAFAEAVSVPAAACYAVPDDMDDAAAAFVEPVSCVVYAMRRLTLEPGENVLIFGAGPMGLLLVQALRHRGAGRVVVVEPQPSRRKLAETWGAITLNADQAMEQRLRQLGRGPGGMFDVVVDATGVPAVIEASLRWLGPRGRFLQFGVAPNTAGIRIEPFALFKNDWTLLGSFALCYDFDAAIAWLREGVVDVRPLVSDVVSLEAFPEALRRFAAGETLKVHVKP